MKMMISLPSVIASVLLAGLLTVGRAAETNLPAPGSVPATGEFKLSSTPPGNGLEVRGTPSISQSNAARLMMQRRAALIKDLREKQSRNTNRPTVTLATNRIDQAKARLTELHRKQADGTITEREQRQLQQLELNLRRIERSSPPDGSGQAGSGDKSGKPER